MEFSTLEEFNKDLKQLLKKYPSLETDLSVLEEYLRVFPKGNMPTVVPMSYKELSVRAGVSLYKVKKFRCKSMQGKGNRSGMRVIYAHEAGSTKITFIEIYKKDKDSDDCDLARINYYLGKPTDDTTTT